MTATKPDAERNGRPVLVIEDEPDSRIMLATLLTMKGYSVVTAEHGAEGLDLAKHAKPCLILLDLMMPVMDGQGFRRHQLADPAIADIPVVLVSAHADAEQVATDMGAVGCLSKPISFATLISTIEDACHRTPR